MATAGWLILLFPLVGSIVIALGYKVWPGRVAGPDRHARDPRLVRRLDRRGDRAREPRRGGEAGRHRRVGLREHLRRRRAAVAAARPALALHGAHGVRRLDADPPLLGLLHGVGPRLHALLRVPELLRVLDAAAGPGRQLPDPDRRLGVRRRGVVPADLVLVPAHDRHARGHQGVRHQRGRRRRPGDRDVLHLPGHRLARLRDDLRRGASRRSRPTRRSSSRAASGCWSARSPSPPRFRSTPGSRTRWRARRRSPP